MFLKNVAYLCFKRKGKLALPVCEKSREYKNVKFPWNLPFFLLLIDNFFRERGGGCHNMYPPCYSAHCM